MAVNLIDSSDIEVTQAGDNIQLNTSTSMASLLSSISTNAQNISNITGNILWTNSSPTSDFSSQNITLSSSDYDAIEIIYKLSTTRTQTKSTGLIPKGNGSVLEFMYCDGNTNFYNTRFINYSTNTSIGIENCYSSQNSTSNSRCIPLYVIGYKTGLFN